MKTDKQLIVMEYNPKQGNYHYNHIDQQTGEAEKAPYSYGWYPVAIIDEETAYDKRFTDMTHAILRPDLEVEYINDVVTSAVKQLGYAIYTNALFMGRFLTKIKTVKY